MPIEKAIAIAKERKEKAEALNICIKYSVCPKCAKDLTLRILDNFSGKSAFKKYYCIDSSCKFTHIETI